MSFDDSAYIRFKTQLFLSGNSLQFPYKPKSKNKRWEQSTEQLSMYVNDWKRFSVSGEFGREQRKRFSVSERSFKNNVVSARHHILWCSLANRSIKLKYYYSLIGVPKMDTWQGCDDISLDMPDPCGTEDRPQSQAPLSYNIAAPSDHN